MGGFTALLQYVKDGETVSAGVVNRPTGVLDDRTQYLYDLLRAAEIGSTVFARGVTVDPAVTVGTPVYWDPNNQRFGRGLVAVTSDIATGALRTADSAMIWGVVYAKTTAADKADILLFGYAALDITPALETGETLAAGGYYLSRRSAGKLSRLKPPVAVPVLKADGNGNIFVAPQWSDLLSAHTHQHFRLRPIPAGTTTPPLTPDHHHVIDVADPDIEGWLPANHAVFGGKAPARAKFGYNMAVNSALTDAWPPLSPSDAVLLQDGVDMENGPDGLVTVDQNGIWWNSDCYGEAPWETDFSQTLIELSHWSEVAYESQSAPGEPAGNCYTYPHWMDLYFTRYGFLTEQTAVTSLTTTDPRIKIFCQGQPGAAAQMGPLQLALDLSFTAVDDGDLSYTAFKRFDPVTQTLHSGLVASGLYAATSNVHLTGEIGSTRVIGGTPRNLYHGAVGITVDTALERELFVQLVRLDGVEEQYFADVMYLGFPVGEATSMRCRISVPETLDVVNPRLTLKFRLLGRGAGTLPALTLTVRRIQAAPQPVFAVLPLTDTAVALSYSVTLDSANQYVDVTSASFAIQPGDEVLFTLARTASDGYSSEVGVLRQEGLATASS